MNGDRKRHVLPGGLDIKVGESKAGGEDKAGRRVPVRKLHFGHVGGDHPADLVAKEQADEKNKVDKVVGDESGPQTEPPIRDRDHVNERKQT